MIVAAAVVLATTTYFAVGWLIATVLGRRLRRVRLAREAWHREYWQRESDGS